LLRHRASLVRLSTMAKNRIHAVLADQGIRQQTGLWTGMGRIWLAELELPPTPRAIVEDYLALLDGLAKPIARLEHQIATLARPDPRIQAVIVLPGIGRLTAMTRGRRDRRHRSLPHRPQAVRLGRVDPGGAPIPHPEHHLHHI
jgi:transposase